MCCAHCVELFNMHVVLHSHICGSGPLLGHSDCNSDIDTTACNHLLHSVITAGSIIIYLHVCTDAVNSFNYE